MVRLISTVTAAVAMTVLIAHVVAVTDEPAVAVTVLVSLAVAVTVLVSLAVAWIHFALPAVVQAQFFSLAFAEKCFSVPVAACAQLVEAVAGEPL